MRKSDIRPGMAYADGKGNVRLVLVEGPQYVLYPEQVDTDCVRYRVVARRGKLVVDGQECSSTRGAFAAWAQAVHGAVEEEVGS